MAYAPVKYTDKQSLMDNAVIKRIFANTTFEVSADDEQQAMLDMIESLWKNQSVTYTQLVTLINTSSLDVGSMYIFEYQTIHKIPYTTELHYGPIETLAAFAIAPNKVHEQVMSVTHPEDTVWWRYDDNVVLQMVEGPLSGSVNFSGAYPFDYDDLSVSQPFLLLGQPVSRPGRIYKRQDNRRNLLAGEDFRGVVKRRWSLQQPVAISNTTIPWVSGDTYTVGDIVTSAGVYYEVLVSHTATPDVTLANDIFYLDLTNLFRSINSPSVDNYLIPTAVYNYVSPTPTYFMCGKYSFLVDNTSHIDVTMFDNDDTANLNEDIPGETYCFNIIVTPVIGAYIEAPDWEFYSNIVFDKYCSNITIKEMSINSTIFRTTNCEIGRYNSNLLVRGIDYQIGTISIKDFNKDCYFRLEPTDVNSPTITIGNGNLACIYIASNYRFGDGNRYSKVYRAAAGSLEDNNTYCFIGVNAGSIFGNTIGSGNSYTILLGNYNSIGNKNTYTYLTGDSHTVQNSTISIRQLSQAGVSVEGQNYVAIQNLVEDFCEYIDIVGSYNTYKTRIVAIQSSKTVQYDHCTFDTGFRYVIFTKIAAGSFTNTRFSGNSTWISKTISLDTNTGMSNLHYNIMINSGLDIGAQYVSSYTNPTTFTTEIIKIL